MKSIFLTFGAALFYTALPAQAQWLAWILACLGLALACGVFARGGRFGGSAISNGTRSAWHGGLLAHQAHIV